MSYEIYAPADIKKYFEKSIKGLFIKSCLKIKTVPRGIIAIDNNVSDTYGVLDTHGRFIKESEYLYGKHRQHRPTLNKFSVCDCDAVYMGWLDKEFGHFMLEHLSRAYVLSDEKYKNMKYVYVNLRHYEEIPEFVYEFFKLLDVERDNIILLNQSTQFKSVSVPEQGFNIMSFSSDEFRNTMHMISENVGNEFYCEKIYLSRGALKHRRTYGERKIENIFAKNGYKIIYPETLPLYHQIQMMKNCKSLAGLAGTALHLSVFMPRGGEVIWLKRNTLREWASRVQYLICKTMGLKFTLVYGTLEKYEPEHFSDAPQIVGMTNYIKKFFDVRGFVYDNSDLEFDEWAMNDYMADLAEYLKNKPADVKVSKSKTTLIRLLSCLIPGRSNRRHVRDWLFQKI